MSTKQEELRSWYIATLFMVGLAATVFVVQHFVFRVFNDVVLEICIFYVPAFIIVVLLLYFRAKFK